MKSFLPKHLRDLLFRKAKNDKEKDEPRQFSSDFVFNDTFQHVPLETIMAELQEVHTVIPRPIVKENILTEGQEEQIVILPSQARRQQLENERDNLHRWKSLTFRQQEIRALVCIGQKNHEIAETLKVAFGTVKSHLETVFDKLGLPDRHAIRLAFRDWDSGY